jgi:hypothetical protein
MSRFGPKRAGCPELVRSQTFVGQVLRVTDTTQGAYNMVFRAVDVVAMIDAERWRGRTTPIRLSDNAMRGLHRLRSGQERCSLEFADRVLCELGPPDLLHQLEDVTAGTALSA